MYGLDITLRQNRRFSYLFVEDLMPILEYFIENESKYNSYNIVPNEYVELVQIAELVKEVSGNDISIKVANEGYGLDYYGDNSRLMSEANCKFTKLEDSIKMLYTYYESRKEIIKKELLLSDK